MTCIIAIKDENGDVWLGGDKMGSNGNTRRIYKDPKVFQVGNFAFGYTSSFYMGQLLKYHWTQPVRTIHQTDDDEYIFKDVMFSLKNLFVKNKFGIEQDPNYHEGQFGNFLMIYKGRIFEVQGNMSILEVDSFNSVGCGEQVAKGAVSALLLNTNLNCHDIIKESMFIVSQHSCGVSTECDIIKCK